MARRAVGAQRATCGWRPRAAVRRSPATVVPMEALQVEALHVKAVPMEAVPMEAGADVSPRVVAAERRRRFEQIRPGRAHGRQHPTPGARAISSMLPPRLQAVVQLQAAAALAASLALEEQQQQQGRRWRRRRRRRRRRVLSCGSAGCWRMQRPRLEPCQRRHRSPAGARERDWKICACACRWCQPRPPLPLRELCCCCYWLRL